MCKLTTISTNDGTCIEIADIKAEIVKQILRLAHTCDKIDYIYIFGSVLEERCTAESDIDLAIVSNVTRLKLYKAKDYDSFKNKLYSLDVTQEYDILQFNSLNALRNSNDFVCKDILSKGKMLYKRIGA